MSVVAYQDTWTAGRVTAPGYRECAGRYNLVRQLLKPLGRRLSVLDFGAAGGYFSFRLAAELGARCVAVDPAPELSRAARANPRAQVHVIPSRLSPRQVALLPRYDVVLALSVLHHNPDWRSLLTALRGRARRLLIVETPHPEEPLQYAPARGDLSEIMASLSRLGPLAGDAPGVRSDHRRSLFAIREEVLRGVVFEGNGNCSRFWRPLTGRVGRTLGYQPVPGSLNIRLNTPMDASVRLYLGSPACSFWDKRRPKVGRGGGDYQFWRARFGSGPNGMDAHVMLPGVRTHGPDCLELVAPRHLRTAWGLQDGTPLWIRLR